MKYLILTLLLATSAQAETFDSALAKTRTANPKCLQTHSGMLIREYSVTVEGATTDGVVTATREAWEICSSTEGWARGPSIEKKVNDAIADTRQSWEVVNCRCQHD